MRNRGSTTKRIERTVVGYNKARMKARITSEQIDAEALRLREEQDHDETL